jgi:hypothetical protein
MWRLGGGGVAPIRRWRPIAQKSTGGPGICGKKDTATPPQRGTAI